MHQSINVCCASISEVIKAEAEQSTLCWKKELKKENSPGGEIQEAAVLGLLLWPGTS